MIKFRKKIIFVILLTLILSGCSAEVNLKVDKNNNVSQNIKIYQDTKILKELNTTSDQYIKNALDYNSANNISYERKDFYNDENFGVEFTKKDTNFCQEFKSSYFSSFFYENNCKENKSDYEISGKTIFAYCSDDMEGCTGVDFVNINVELPEKAIESDADSIEGTKYTWHYDSSKEGTFNLKIKKYNTMDGIIEKITSDEETNNTSKTMAILLGSIVLIVVVTFIVLYGKYKKKKIDY